MTTPTLTFLHTSPVHVATFESLCAELAPDVPTRHLVDETLLRDAREAGRITPSLAGRVADTVQAAVDEGAGVVLCTCSTIGDCAERAGGALTSPVLRVDRAMAERAVAIGPGIVLAAALASTIEPTRQLLLDAAGRAGRRIEVTELLCSDAWAHFERNDLDAYHRAIAAALHSLPGPHDAIVLAQASMAGATTYCADLALPILSSPRLGLEAALSVWRDTNREP